MKKLIAIVAVLSAALLIGGLAYAQTPVEDTVDVSLTIGGTFTFGIDEASVTLIDPNPDVGDSTGGGVTLRCGSNYGNEWAVDLRATELSSAVATIPFDDPDTGNPAYEFNTYPLLDGTGTASLGQCVDDAIALAITDQTVYTAHASEYSDTEVLVGAYFTIRVPWSQQVGTYSSTITATMYETTP